MFLKVLYAFVLAFFIVLVSNTGILAFYPSPSAPNYPATSTALNSPTAEDQKLLDSYNIQNDQFTKDQQQHDRNVILIYIAWAIFWLVIGGLLIGRVCSLPEGFLLGSALTIYSMNITPTILLSYSSYSGLGGVTGTSQWSFYTAVLGLLVAIFFGYYKLADCTDKKHCCC